MRITDFRIRKTSNLLLSGHTVRRALQLGSIGAIAGLSSISAAQTALSNGESPKPQNVHAPIQAKPRPVQVWFALYGGYGPASVRDDYGDLSRFTSVDVGGSLGVGGFVGTHLQLGGEFTVSSYKAIKKSSGTLILEAGDATFLGIGPSLRITGYFGNRAGPFVSGAFKIGLFQDLYSAELGYAWQGLIGSGRTSLAVGYEGYEAVSFEGWEFASYHAFLTVRVEVLN